MTNYELTVQELEFLAAALDGPLLAFAPFDDPMIAELIRRGLAQVLHNPDKEHFLVELTDAGKAMVFRQLR